MNLCYSMNSLGTISPFLNFCNQTNFLFSSRDWVAWNSIFNCRKRSFVKSSDRRKLCNKICKVSGDKYQAGATSRHLGADSAKYHGQKQRKLHGRRGANHNFDNKQMHNARWYGSFRLLRWLPLFGAGEHCDKVHEENLSDTEGLITAGKNQEHLIHLLPDTDFCKDK